MMKLDPSIKANALVDGFLMQKKVNLQGVTVMEIT